jgi:uncharacterized protein YbjT (DUF2867 family)
VRAQVQVVQGSSDDEEVLTGALEGAESLFLLVPPLFTVTDNNEYYLKFARATSAAVKAQKVKRIVTVSGVGRRSLMKAGPVSDSFAKDAEIERSGVDFRALWCPSFMENMMSNIGTLKSQGTFYGCLGATAKAPWVATRDIAASAAKLLLDRAWTGQGGVAVLGPEDLSQNDIAGITGEVLGRPISYRQIPPDALKSELLKYGASGAFAQSVIEMLIAKDKGLDLAEARTAENTTPTSYRTWCTEVLKPAMQG